MQNCPKHEGVQFDTKKSLCQHHHGEMRRFRNPEPLQWSTCKEQVFRNTWVQTDVPSFFQLKQGMLGLPSSLPSSQAFCPRRPGNPKDRPRWSSQCQELPWSGWLLGPTVRGGFLGILILLSHKHPAMELLSWKQHRIAIHLCFEHARSCKQVRHRVLRDVCVCWELWSCSQCSKADHASAAPWHDVNLDYCI